MLTYCLDDASRVDLPDDASYRLPAVHGPNDLSVHPVGFGDIEIRRITTRLATVHLKDFSSDLVIVWSPNGKAAALNYSDGGAIGNFHTRLFLITADKAIEKTSAINAAVLDFKSRHYCQPRGNNVRVLKWIDDTTILLLTSVYETGDCGHDAGYSEGYVIDVPTGQIRQRRLAFNQLANFKGVCLQNPE